MTKKEEREEAKKQLFNRACNSIANGEPMRKAILDNMSMAAFHKYQIDHADASELYSQVLISRAGYIAMLLEEVLTEEEIHPSERKVKMDGYKMLLESYSRARWGRQVVNKNENTNTGVDLLAEMIKTIQKS